MQRGACIRVLVVLATCATAALAPMTNAAAPAYLRVVGSSSSYVDVTLRTPTALDYSRITIKAKGSLAGVYVEPLTGPPEEGLGFVVPLKFRASGLDLHPLVLGRGDVDPEPIDGPPATLQPGRHRVHLLADGPATISIPLVGSGTTSLSLRPTRRSAVTASTLDMTPRPPNADLGPVAADQPHAVPDGAITVVALRQVWRQGGGRVIAATGCLAKTAMPGSCYVSPTHPEWQVEEEQQTSGGDHYWVSTGYYYPGDLTPGQYHASYSTVLTDKAESVVAFVMSLRLRQS